MALHYHGYMAKMLHAYDPRYTMAECEALAWEGLQKTDLFQSKSDAEQKRIEERSLEISDKHYKDDKPCGD